MLDKNQLVSIIPGEYLFELVFLDTFFLGNV